MTVKLYIMQFSPPARSALTVTKMLGVPAEIIEVDLMKEEQHAPEFLKKNPLHTIPVLEDNGLTLHDSHAIMMYLVDVYGKDDSLYPKDTKKRARVNQMLLFNGSVLFPRGRNFTYYAFVHGETKPIQRKYDEIKEAYGYLEEFLTRNKFLALDHITIADIASFPLVSALDSLETLDATKFPKTFAWLSYMKSQPFSKYSEEGDAIFRNLIKNTIIKE